MAKKIKKTILYPVGFRRKSFGAWFLILALIGLTIGVVLNIGEPKVQADTAGTSVTVSNVAPAFTVITTDSSDGTTPTNAESNVTFAATATDVNSDQWKLLLCKTAGVTGIDCDGGAGDRWCVSASAVNSGTQNTCAYTTLVGDAESNNWWSYACDASACSAAETTNSPFKVNHRPSFTVYADDSPVAPATTVTWTTTASDADTDTAADTVSLYVCKANDFTGTTCGGGGTWCSATAAANNPTCNTTAPRPDGNWTAYGFVVDSHNFAASGSPHGTDSVLAVSNATPSITASAISLLNTTELGLLTLTVEQAETTGFKVKFTVVDANSCVIKGGTPGTDNEIASSFINVRMSEKATTACDASGEYDANDCYPDAYVGWDPTCTQDAATCAGETDTDAVWTCTFPFQYHPDSTVTGTPKVAYYWVAAVQATDNNSANTGLIDSTSGSNEMDKFMAYDLNTANIVYGSIAPNGTSSGQTTTIEATGNVGLDTNLSGTQLCNDYPTCAGGNDIAIAQQKYHLTTLDFDWDAVGTALSETPTEAETDCAKTTTTGTPATNGDYWKLRVPTGIGAGSYTGQDTIAGKVDNETYGS